MPIYEYCCPKCQKTFEEWVRLSEAHREEACPACGTPSPRVMSHTSFVLKGGGWYVSDYGYRKGVKEEGAGNGAAAKPGASDTPAAGGKPAPAAPPAAKASAPSDGATAKAS